MVGVSFGAAQNGDYKLVYEALSLRVVWSRYILTDVVLLYSTQSVSDWRVVKSPC